MIPATINQAIAALVLEGLSSPCRPYLKILLLANYEEIRRPSSGGVQPNLNLGLVRKIAVNLPPLVEQIRIVAEVERRLSLIDDLESAIVANLKRADRLRQSILKRAFEGKLVPQDPADEPAEAMLARLGLAGAGEPGFLPVIEPGTVRKARRK